MSPAGTEGTLMISVWEPAAAIGAAGAARTMIIASVVDGAGAPRGGGAEPPRRGDGEADADAGWVVR